MTRPSWQKSHCWGSSRTNIVPTDNCTPITPQIAPLHRRLGACVNEIRTSYPRPQEFTWVDQRFCVRSHHVPRPVRPDSERFRTAPRTSRHVLWHGELAEPPSSALGG